MSTSKSTSTSTSTSKSTSKSKSTSTSTSMSTSNPTEAEIMRAYYAGLIASKGTIIIYGTCAERGTYMQFAMINMHGSLSDTSKEAILEFTNYVNTAQVNFSKTGKKINFRLTRKEAEILPLVKNIGVADIFFKKWEEVRQFDIEHDLVGIWPNCGVLPDWQTKTMRVDIPLQNLDGAIMEFVLNGIVQNHPNVNQDILINAFIEGQKGLTIGHRDLEILMKGHSIMEKYSKAA